METQVKSHRLHPLIAAAAVAIMLVCLVGVAAMTGLLPNSNSARDPQQKVAEQKVAELDAAAKAADQKAEAAQAAAEEAARKRDAARLAAAKSTTEQKTKAAPVACHNCGRVESVRAVQTAAKPSGVGVVGGAVVGGLLGNQVGGGTGRTLATVAGAVGGGYAGNEIEKRTRKTTSYDVRVRMEDGQVRSFPYNNVPPWHEGDHVRVVDGYLHGA